MFKWLLVLLISLNAFAAPQSVEVWFLSAQKKAEVQRLINKKPFVLRSLTAELQCQEMGDYCFDPQYGLYKKDDFSTTISTDEMVEDKGPSIPSGKSVERDLIDCDPNNFFDIFCGKARKEAKGFETKLDLWIDTSSSMREMDFSDKNGACFRKSMMQRLDGVCPFNQKVNVMMFDTSIKQAGTIDSLCNNSGLNDYKRLIDWIERSEAKRLVIITDIYEFHKEFSDYIESKHGKLRGDKDPLTASQLLDLVDDLSKTCK